MGRAEILKSIKENKPDLLPLPEIDVTNFIENINLLAAFKEKVVGVGGSVIDLASKSEIDGSLRLKYPNAAKIIDCSQETTLGSVSISEIKEPHKLEDIDLAIIKGEFGVAENGAVWISETQFPIRVLPFIANDLVIVLDKTAICQHLHEAYALTSKRERTFGVFIAGPSKTADIEQCLVVGAQGAMSLTVVLI